MNMKKPRMMKMMDSAKPEGMSMPRFGARAMRPGGMAKGGKIHEDAAMDKKLIRKEIARAEKMEDKSEGKGMKRGGKVHEDIAMDRKLIREEMSKAKKKMAKGGGVETKGKTKGKFI